MYSACPRCVQHFMLYGIYDMMLWLLLYKCMVLRGRGEWEPTVLFSFDIYAQQARSRIPVFRAAHSCEQSDIMIKEEVNAWCRSIPYEYLFFDSA